MEQTPKALHQRKRVKIAPKYLDDYYANATLITSDQAMKKWHEDDVKMPHNYDEALKSRNHKNCFLEWRNP
ncbi:hypothetical protein CCR75_002767 [Bremia lactucae]|uniref:Uncharacterized protein n=1 Tax=Bremia lactucae TaxID=4779 RepID=A0A976NY70_BRELC|nr:hypothetical protein CCR75_002767 [Bremia lactucae]